MKKKTLHKEIQIPYISKGKYFWTPSQQMKIHFFKKQSVYRMESKLIHAYKTCKLRSSGLSHKTTCCKTVCRYQERMGRGLAANTPFHIFADSY